MQPNRSERRRGRPAPQIRPVEVRAVTSLSPNIVNVRFGGPELKGFTIAGPTGHLKLFLPQVGQREIDFAALAAPRGERPPSAPVMRTFTPRRFDASSSELDVVFYVHGEGPASTFASTAQPGDRAAVSGPSRPHLVKDDCYQFIAGDETALPAIEMILESLPADAAGVVLLELGDVNDAIMHPSSDGIEVVVVPRDHAARAGDAMNAAIREFAFPDRSVQAWVAGESVAIRAARAALLEKGVQHELLTTRGYWRAGVAGHGDHDMGED